MDNLSFKNLNTGDIVRGKHSSKSFVVMENDRANNKIIVVRIEEMTNPEEWDLILKASFTRITD